MANKHTVAFTVDKEILKKFDKFAKDNCINKSALVEKLIQEYLESHGK